MSKTKTKKKKNHTLSQKSWWSKKKHFKVFQGFIMRQVVISGLDYMTAKLQQGSVLQQFHFQSWRWLTQQQDSSPTGRDDSQDQQLVAAFSFCFLPGLPVTPFIQQNRRTTQPLTKKKRRRDDAVQFGRIWEDTRKLFSSWVPEQKHKTACEMAERRERRERRTAGHLPRTCSWMTQLPWQLWRGCFVSSRKWWVRTGLEYTLGKFCSLQFLK